MKYRSTMKSSSLVRREDVKFFSRCSNLCFFSGVTYLPPYWAKGYLISCTVCLYLLVFLLLCFWHFSICRILFSREALLRDNTILTRYRRQVVQLLIVLMFLFFILILPYKIWALIDSFLTYSELGQIGFHRHTFIHVITRSLLYLNSAVSRNFLFFSLSCSSISFT